MWIKPKNGRIYRVATKPVGDFSEWVKVPENFTGAPGDKLEWFDESWNRIPDETLVRQGKREDFRGKFFHKEKQGETKIIYGLDEEPGEEWTKEEPLENEPFQKWDNTVKAWIVDTEKKAESERQQKISRNQTAIEEEEKKIQRSQRAIIAGAATEEDRQYFVSISQKINALRIEKQKLQSA
jgi:hypothetical protein